MNGQARGFPSPARDGGPGLAKQTVVCRGVTFSKDITGGSVAGWPHPASCERRKGNIRPGAPGMLLRPLREGPKAYLVLIDRLENTRSAIASSPVTSRRYRPCGV